MQPTQAEDLRIAASLHESLLASAFAKVTAAAAMVRAMKQTLFVTLFAAALATAAPAQCPPPQSVVQPFQIPVAAGGWSIQHFGQPLAAGQLEYVMISLPAQTPLPLNALPGIFCNAVGNTPCLYIDPATAVTWFNAGPSLGVNATVSVTWPNNPAFAGVMFLAQFGVLGCVGPQPDLSVLVTGIII